MRHAPCRSLGPPARSWSCSVSLSAYRLRILSERLGRLVGIPTRLHFSAIYRLAELIIHNDNRVDTLPFTAKKRRVRRLPCTLLSVKPRQKPACPKSWQAGSRRGAIPIISDAEGFRAYYVVYAPDDTVTAISIFNDYAGAEESNRRVLAWIEQSLTPLLAGPATAMAGPVIVHTLA